MSLYAVLKSSPRSKLSSVSWCSIASCGLTIRGDTGWGTFSERCMRGCILYKKKIMKMEENRCVRKVREKVDQKNK